MTETLVQFEAAQQINAKKLAEIGDDPKQAKYKAKIQMQHDVLEEKIKTLKKN